MNNNSEELASRLRNSLGATSAPELSDDLVTGAGQRRAPRIVSRKRGLQVAGAATFAIAAVTVGALVVASPFDRAPLFTATGGSAPTSLGANEDAQSDMRIGNWVEYQYVAGDGLNDQGGKGHVYQLKRARSPESVLAKVAEVFGVGGAAAKSSYFDKAYPSYVVGPEDGTAPSVTIGWSGTGSWWYNDPSAYPAVVCSGSAPSNDGTVKSEEPADSVEPEVCETPELAENLAPSESEARAIALEIFESTGLDVSASGIRVTADEWQTVATASLVVNGAQTALDWSVAWSPLGTISYAYGHSIEVVDRGSYDTVSAVAAVDRLSDWRWYGSAGPDYQGGAMLYATDTSRSGTATGEEDASAEEPTVDSTAEPTTEPGTVPGVEPDPLPTEDGEPMPDPTVEPTVEPVPEPTPEVVVITVNEAEKTLLLMWDSNGNAWLVPGLAMQHPDGWWNTVVSLVEGVIELPEPIAIEPYMIDDGELTK